MTDQKKYMGMTPSKCDICQVKLTRYFVDGNTTTGIWATMCAACHNKNGVGFGTGCGQEYQQSDAGHWYKTGG